MASASAAGVELADPAAVRQREGLRALAGLGEQLVDALGAAAAYERLEVPGGCFQGGFHGC